jgi:hypothetical protein
MLMLDQWEQTAVFDPSDPTQKKIEKYAGVPGAYASFYFNRMPVTGSLKGPVLLGGPFTSGISTGAGITLGLLLGSLAIAGGQWALRKAGVLKKPAGVGGLGFFRFGKKSRRRGR